jgi:enoyl-[acyl-carrier protein] reductase I
MTAIDLSGKRGLVVGISNEHSLAWAAARCFRAAGAELAITYHNARSKTFVAPLAEQVGASLLMPCDVLRPGELEAVFDAVRDRWGRLDFVFHSLAGARARDLGGRLLDCPAEGFAEAMAVTCHSFVRAARAAETLMPEGGALVTVSYFGAEKVVEHYNVMGPVMAAHEAAVRYLAHELGPRQIRVNAISAGPVSTRAASGIRHLDELLDESSRRAAERRLATADEVGRMAFVLVSDLAAATTGEVVHVDAGFHIEGMVFHGPPGAGR